MKENLRSHTHFYVCWLGLQVSECWCLGKCVSEQGFFCFWWNTLKFKLLISYLKRKERKSQNRTSKLLVHTNTSALSIQHHTTVCELWPLAESRSWKDCITWWKWNQYSLNNKVKVRLEWRRGRRRSASDQPSISWIIATHSFIWDDNNHRDH